MEGLGRGLRLGPPSPLQRATIGAYADSVPRASHRRTTCYGRLAELLMPRPETADKTADKPSNLAEMPPGLPLGEVSEMAPPVEPQR